MMRLLCQVACCATLFLTLSFSSSWASSLNSSTFSLKNGLTVVVIPNHKIPAVSHMIWYRTGAYHETPGKSGLAHFLEHLMFKGTKKFPDGIFSKRVAQHGGTDNAFTSYDYTAYFQHIAKAQLPLVMEMEADRMQGIIVDEESAYKERDVIVEERNYRVENNPKTILMEAMRRALYRNHPYGRPVIGWQHEIKALTLQDAYDFYRTYYAPNNATLVVAGDITEKEMRQLAKRYYGDIPKKELPEHPTYKEPPLHGQHTLTHRDVRVTTPELIRYYLTPSQNQQNPKQGFALMLLAYMLGGSDTSILYQSLIDEKKIASTVEVDYQHLGQGDVIFSIYATPKDHISPHTLEKEIDTLLKTTKTRLTSSQLERAKRLLEAQSIYARDSFKGLAFIAGHLLASNLSLTFLEEWESSIAAITLDDVKTAYEQHLNPKVGYVTGYLLKEQSHQEGK